MNFRMFGCGKYRRLMHEKFDRALKTGEREFMSRHRSVCDECRLQEMQGSSALNFLRMSGVEEEEMSNGFVFEERVLRKWRVQNTRESVRYWSPAFIGAAIAGLTVLAALQLVSGRPTVPNSTNPPGEARLERNSSLPEIDLNKIERMR